MSRMRTVREVYDDAMAEPEPAPGSGRADIRGYIGEIDVRLHGDLEVPAIHNLDAAIVERVMDSAGDGWLKMSGWHCGPRTVAAAGRRTSAATRRARSRSVWTWARRRR